MMKKAGSVLCILLCAAGLILNSCQGKPAAPDNEKSKEEKQRRETAVVYNNVYEKEIGSEKEAVKAIEKEAAWQRSTYENPEVQQLEAEMEEKYGIFQVTLGEIDIEVAEKIEAAFSYMYEKYPVLKGKLTNLTIGNTETGAIAETRYRDFISPPEGLYPVVMKHEVVLNGKDFLNPERLENVIRKSVSEGHWVKDMNIEAIVVHELGHVLLNQIRMERYGLERCYYIDAENAQAYASYNTDILADNQTTVCAIMRSAYEKYKYKDSVSLEELCASISGYASGIQDDGGIFYEEACAEAVVDVYLHGENSNEFSQQILAEMDRFL